jgi:hypothetical protein
MPDDRERDYMNTLFRTQRSTPSFDASANARDVNAAIRAAAGYPTPEPAPQQQRQQHARQSTTDPRSAFRRLLAAAARHVIDSEPIAGIADAKSYDEWLWTRPVVDLLDADGRLPGEQHYDPISTSLIQGADWPGEQAMAARKARWQQLANHFRSPA